MLPFVMFIQTDSIAQRGRLSFAPKAVSTLPRNPTKFNTLPRLCTHIDIATMHIYFSHCFIFLFIKQGKYFILFTINIVLFGQNTHTDTHFVRQQTHCEDLTGTKGLLLVIFVVLCCLVFENRE